MNKTMERSTFLTIAHRGASAYAPENTFAAFELALQMGVRHIELDVRVTADGQAVVIHDETLDRTTSGAGPVAQRSLAELKEFDAGSWFDSRFASEQVPAFTEVLERYAKLAHLHTEIKSGQVGFCKHIIDEIHQHGAEQRVTITAFELAHLVEVRRLAPNLSTGWLVRNITEELIATAKRMGIDQLCPQASTVSPEIVRLLHNEGFTVRAWGVPSEAVMRAVVRSGADGMTVNFPDKLIHYLAMGEKGSTPI
ncbi:MAG: hypothetical protein IPM07_15930 [Anaerolineales bacterium]|nr:hypothetical protein [Anaerolineales bacterium]